MDTIKMAFFLFSPPWKKVKIYFSTKEILEGKLFRSLAQKTVPNRYTQTRTNEIFYCLFNWFFKREKEIPNTKVFLIYEGYDSTVFFYTKENGIGVVRKKNGRYIEEDFLGYPIHHDFSLDFIPNKKLLTKILQNHWAGLKSGKEQIHGDFTHNNILVNDKGDVTFIDSKSVSSDTPIITDLFYFYAYFLIRASKYQPKNKRRFKNIKRELDSIYLDIFKMEDISKQIEGLKIENFNIKKKEKLFEFWKEVFKEMLTNLP